MKKLLSLFAVALLLGACSNDDDKKTSAVNIDQLAKKWYNVSTKFGNSDPIPYDGHEACGKDHLIFTANSNVVKDVDFVDCQTDEVITTGVYTVNDETLTTTLGSTTIVYTIKKLNSSTLHLETTFNGNTILDIYTSNP